MSGLTSGWADDRLMLAYDMLFEVIDQIAREEGSLDAMDALSVARSHIIFADDHIKAVGQ